MSSNRVGTVTATGTGTETETAILMSTKPLNPLLYERLKTVFGHVRVSNEGQAMVSEYLKDPLTGNWKKNLTCPGEYYQVCCDRCRDTRFRLYFSHTWGRRDEQGWRNLWLMLCYNENCYRDPEARKDMYERLCACRDELATARVFEGEVVTTPRDVKMPGPMFRLDTLPEDHPANVYMASRHFDPVRLGRFYGVGYCPQSFYYLARHRIIIPVYDGGRLKGWQARYIGELDWKDKTQNTPPKYWTCPGMDRGRLLYNLDNARRYRTAVVVEGPTDVFAVGPMAVASLGFPPTKAQLRRLVDDFRNHSVVFLFDPDVRDRPATAEKAQKLEIEMATEKPFAGGHAWVWLPGGADPGKHSREFLREFITKRAARRDVAVDWALR
jgi:hypothetical protein